MLHQAEPLRLLLAAPARACPSRRRGSARRRAARSAAGRRPARAGSPSRRPAGRSAGRAVSSGAAKRARSASRSSTGCRSRRVDAVGDHGDARLVDAEDVGDVAAHVVRAGDDVVGAPGHPASRSRGCGLRVLVDPALVAAVLRRVDRRQVGHAEALGQRGRRPSATSQSWPWTRSGRALGQLAPAARMSAFMSSTQATNAVEVVLGDGRLRDAVHVDPGATSCAGVLAAHG